MTDAEKPEISEEEAWKEGPFSFMLDAVKNSTQVLIYLRNDHKLLGRVKAFDRHLNMVLMDAKEIWTDKRTKASSPSVRYIRKMFLRGDSVILITPNPLGGPGEPIPRE